jgi:aromatic-L-amino-acid/L-tryptophan decarboxylase
MREPTLDLPDADLRALLQRTAAMAADYLAGIAQRPIIEPMTAADRADRIHGDRYELPQDGEPLEDLLAAVNEVIATSRHTGPAFFAYVLSPAAPIGVAGDLIASALNQNLGSYRGGPAAAEVERTVVRWLGQLVGFADDAHGLLMSGGSMANLSALFVALRAHADATDDRRRIVVYASDQVHFSIPKAADLLGVAVRTIASDSDFRLEPDALRARIAADRDAGLRPCCVVASSGTVATGAIDPLETIAEVAVEEGLWLHIDGAYGALAAADPASRPRFAGLDRADSLSIDPHKWLAAPIDCGCLLLRDAATSRAAFSHSAGDYVQVLGQQDATEAFAFWDHGPELTRRFRALKVWMILRYHGARRIAAAIAEDIRLADHLAARVRAADDFELLAAPSLSICCFRHVPATARGDDAALDALNERIMTTVQRGGRAYLSNATIDGRFALRACITNFRTTEGDLDRLLDVVREAAA